MPVNLDPFIEVPLTIAHQVLCQKKNEKSSPGVRKPVKVGARRNKSLMPKEHSPVVEEKGKFNQGNVGWLRPVQPYV